MSQGKPKVFFFHIPKCAGMSIWHALWDQYGQENVLQVGIKDQRLKYEAMTSEEATQFKAIGGHGWLKIYRDKLGDMEDYFKITTLRHPVDRVISAYNFIAHLETHHQYDVVKQQSIEEFAEKEMPNMMCRLISGRPDHEAAIDVLDNWFDAFCYLEDIDELMGKLQQNFGRPARSAQHKNQSTKIHTRSDVSDKALKTMEERNLADLKLFEHYKGSRS